MRRKRDWTCDHFAGEIFGSTPRTGNQQLGNPELAGKWTRPGSA
jgi:hypothetical protein